MSKALTIAVKTLKESVRQPKNLAISLGLPLAFMLIFGLAFGGAEETTYRVAVLNEDGAQLSVAYVSGLAGLSYASGARLLDVRNLTDADVARAQLERGDIEALVVVPANFSRDAVPQASPPAAPTTPLQQPQQPPSARGAEVTLQGDPSRTNFQVASQIVAAYTAEFSEAVGGASAVNTNVETVTSTELTTFDYIAPGLMVFAILNIVPQAASLMAREAETRTLDRVRMSPTGALALLSGVAIAQLILATVSLALMFLMAELMGFHNQGSYFVAYLIVIGAALTATAIGLAIASFARNQQEAASFGALVSVPLSFLSGAFFPIPGVRLFGDVGLYDLIPTTHAVNAIRQVLTFGRGIDEVASAIYALMALAALYFVAGVAFFRRARLRAE